MEKQHKSGIKAEVRLLQFLWKAASGHHAVIIFTLILQVGVGLLPAAITYYVQRLFSDGSDSLFALLNTRNLLILFAVMLGYILLKESIAVAQSYAMTDIKRTIERKYIDALSASDYATVHDRMDNRNMMAITRESEMVTVLLPVIYRSFFGAPITILAFVALLLIVSPFLTLVVTILIAVVVGCSVFLRKIIKETSRRLFARLSDIHVSFAEWLKGYKVFMIYGATNYMRSNMTGIVDDTASLSKKVTRIQCTQSIMVEMLTYIVVIVFMWMLQGTQAQTSISALISFPAAILFIRNEAIKITRCYSKLAQTESSARHLLHDTEQRPEQPALKQWSGSIRSVALQQVTFGYDTGKAMPLIHDASLQFTQPGLYLLTGPSGIGKSTCFDLIMGLRRPTAGRVLYNDVDISGYALSSLLARISYVEQEPFMFEGTIYDNIALGKEIDIDKVLQICRDLRLEHIVASKADLRKHISVDGKDLSAGERQRLAFVRAMVKNPDLLLLDESTSNVDTAARDIMVQYMKRISTDRIVLCISHDEYLRKVADVTIILEDGKFKNCC